MKLSVIIVSYNTKELLKRCLYALEKNSLPKNLYEVIIIDNASTDGSAELATIKNHHNFGFAAANNQGIQHAKGQYIVLLNSDTEIVSTALEELVKFMEHCPQAGIASAQLLNPDGSIQSSGGYLPNLSNITAWMLLLDDIQPLKRLIRAYHVNRPKFYSFTHQLGWVQGASMIIRKKTLDEIGLLDEKIFMYGEDVELCQRAKNHHWQVWTVAEAQVIHAAFQSSGGSNSNALLGEYRGLLYLFKKHHHVWKMPLVKMLLRLGALIRMLLFGTILKDTRKYAVYKQAFSLV